jgi:hypothetical protein
LEAPPPGKEGNDTRSADAEAQTEAVQTRLRYLGFIALLACGASQADGARIGLEYESEKDRKTGRMNDAFTLKPGWEFPKDGLINLVELLIDRNRDRDADSDGIRAKETKLFLRIRHSGSITDRLAYYVRGGVGRSFNNEHDFSYAYIEPGLKYEISPRWEWTAALREGNSIDGTEGERFGKFITGPSFSFDKNNEVELRYVRAFRDKDARAWQIGYTHRF